MEVDWGKITEEVLNSEYVKGFVEEVMKDIKEGRKAFEDTDIAQPYGFGEDCYYKTKKDLLQDATYQAFDEDIEKECPTLLKWLYDKVQDKLKYEITNPKRLKDYKATSFGNPVIKIEIDYAQLLEEACEQVQNHINKMTNQKIEQYIQKITTQQ